MTLRVAIECGGTRSRAGLYSETGDCITSFESRGANPVDHGPAYVIALIVSIVHRFTPAPDEVYAAIAGVRTADLAPRIARGVAARLDGRSVYIADDVTPMLHENLVNGPGVLAIAGTGSCVMARAETGEIVRAGGRGALFGDPGSAYQTAVAGLRAAADAIDGVGPDTVLVETLPVGAGLLQLEEFRDWAKIAPKSKIAALAPLISHAADKGDSAAIRCLHDQATLLSGQVFAAAQRAQLEHPDRVLFHGGLVENATSFRDKFREALQARWPGVHVEPAAIVGHEAVARHALRNSASNGFISAAAEPTPSLLQTEQRSSGPSLDTLGPTGIVQSMAEQDARAAWASAQAEPDVANLIDATVQRFRQGGRIVYLGAGTSGRLGVLDASECHPTFGVSPERVIGIIAGGDPALRNSIEGAEDDVQLAVRDLDHLDPPLSQRDVVIGISASGTTPYVRAALDYARATGALTALVACNFVPDSAADHVICLDTGPECLPGSTRLKAGSATKMVLNQISTGVLALCGYVYDGYMVGVTPTNAKLRARAIRILSEILGIQAPDAQKLLDGAGGAIPVAILMHRMDLDPDAARRKLKEAGGSLRYALELV